MRFEASSDGAIEKSGEASRRGLSLVNSERESGFSLM